MTTVPAQKDTDVRRDSRGEGFTLIELLVVVLIIGILAAIAVPTFLGQRSRAQETEAQSDLRNAIMAGKSMYNEIDADYSNVSIAGLKAIEPTFNFVDAEAGTTPDHYDTSPETLDAGNTVYTAWKVGGQWIFMYKEAENGTTWGVLDVAFPDEVGPNDTAMNAGTYFCELGSDDFDVADCTDVEW